MKGITKILVAIDFSDYSAQTMRYAADLADELKSQLIIVNVINQRDVEAIKNASLTVSNISVGNFLEEQEKERTQEIENLMKETSFPDLPIKNVICVGVPFQKLIQIAKDEGIDLVVMGRKGRSNLASVIFGSTAEKMFRHCPVPLLSVRERGFR